VPGSISDGELSDLLLRACHDLRAPARAIRTYSELLLRDQTPGPDFNERLGYLVDGAHKIDLLVDGLASYAVALRLEADSFREIGMESLLRNVLARMAEPLRAHDAVVTYDKLPRVRGDADRLIELLQRLLENALQHCGAAAPRVHISAEKMAAEWRFAVRDNGIGIPAADLERIFRPFERSSRQHPGAGMGLAIARAIVERHGGKIWAESTADGGATIYFTLPAN